MILVPRKLGVKVARETKLDITTTMKNFMRNLGGAGILYCATGVAGATIIGFGGTQGSNASIDASNELWSHATGDVDGLTVVNGATPNIAIAFDDQWDYHNIVHFTLVEEKTLDERPFDTIGTDPDIAQADGRDIAFTVDEGFALVLNSFDFGLSSETADQGNTWTISLTDSLGETVWSETVIFSNVETSGAGDVKTITPNFTGLEGEDYNLHFNLDEELGGTSYGGGRNAIDNLSFNQISAVPERPEVTQVELKNGAFEITVTGLNPGKSYLLKRGADLLGFPETVSVFQPLSTSEVLTDPELPAGVRSFYRIEKVDSSDQE
ncbi:hypothetical protein V2O64_14810 [Verrucomicrobiaceae bacterium 227]